MAKKYLRKSGCLSLKDADQLWLDLSAYRKATGSKTMYARQKFGRGWAIYEVVEVSDAEAKRSGAE
jgi:hypothetical protein